MNDVEQETPPLLLDRYRIEGPLGEGGLGTVVRAFDTRLKRLVAIKTLKRAAYTHDPEQFRAVEERFAREAEAGARMRMHANLVAVHDLFVEADRTQYLVLEFVPGGTMRDRIAADPLALSEALRLAADIAQGLQVAHEMGLVHRDIKLANIFLTAEGHAKVGDFGIAQIDDISGRTHTTSGHPGTPLYMSPEQERLTAYLRPASDQYSLGLVLFEMLTGQVYKRIGVREATALLAREPTQVAAVVTRMLAEDPDDRYPGMREVVRALQAVERNLALAETQVATRPAEPAPLSSDESAADTVRHDTLRVGLQPVPALSVPRALAPAAPSPTRYDRRAILIGAAGLLVAAGAAGAAMGGLRHADQPVATATTVGTAIAAVAATSAPPTALTVAALPTATATAVPAVPIVITAPPIVVTATPTPTPVPRIPTATSPPPPTQPPAPRSFRVADTPAGVDGTTLGRPIGVYLRHTPRLNDHDVAYDDGTRLTQIGPDTTGDGHTWRHVRAPDNREGYLLAEYTASVASGTFRVANTGGVGLYLNHSPRTGDHDVPYKDGTRLVEIGTDVSGDGHLWHHVRAPDGKEGYIPADYSAEA